MFKGIELETILTKILYLVASSGNELVTNISTLSQVLEIPKEDVRKKLIHMSKKGIIRIKRIDGVIRVGNYEDEMNLLKLSMRIKKPSLIALASNIYFEGKVHEHT